MCDYYILSSLSPSLRLLSSYFSPSFSSSSHSLNSCISAALSYQVENEQPVIYNKKNYGDKFKFRGSKKEDVDIV